MATLMRTSQIITVLETESFCAHNDKHEIIPYTPRYTTAFELCRDARSIVRLEWRREERMSFKAKERREGERRPQKVDGTNMP